MPKKYPEEYIIAVVKKYESGISIKDLAQNLHIASSTLYRWVENYKTIPRKKGEYSSMNHKTPAQGEQVFYANQSVSRQGSD